MHYVERTASTMDIARDMARKGAPGFSVVVAGVQEKGRGRLRRIWQSPEGGLYFTMVLRPDLPPILSPRVNFAASLILSRVIESICDIEVRVKWPNDLLLSEEKVAGMLLENVSDPTTNKAVVVIGTGINLDNHPEDLPQPAISLDAYGLTVTPADALEALALTTHEWLKAWGEGATFPTIRRAWLDRAGPLGRPMRVNLNGVETEGEYAGLNPDGALRLMTSEGEKLVTAGDVFFAS